MVTKHNWIMKSSMFKYDSMVLPYIVWPCRYLHQKDSGLVQRQCSPAQHNIALGRQRLSKALIVIVNIIFNDILVLL